MPRTEARQTALVYCVLTVVLVLCLFAWVAILTHDVADPPGTTVWPPSKVTQNACGPVGAWFSHWAFYYAGWGGFPLLLLITAAVIAKLRKAEFNDMWLRFAGTCLIVAVASTTASTFPHLWTLQNYPLPGPGGVIGVVAADFCRNHFQTVGTMILLAAGMVVGLILAADQWVMKLARLLGWARQNSVRVIATGSTVVTGAAAAGVERLAARLATAGVSNAPAAPDSVPTARISPDSTSSARAVVDAAVATPRFTAEATQSARSSTKSAPEPRLALAINAQKPLLEAALNPPQSTTPPQRSDPAARDDKSANLDSLRNPSSPPAQLLNSSPDAQSITSRAEKPAAAVAPSTHLDHPPAERDLEAPPPPTTALVSIRRSDADAPSTPPKPAAPHSDPVITQIAPTPTLSRLGTDAKPPPARSFERPDGKPYELPPLSLVDDPTPIDRESMEILCKEKAYILEQTLNEFRLEVRVVAIETGPVITVFELKLAPGIKVSQVVSLANDMARALKAPAVRVVAPLPGKNTIGIEVPNMDKEKVRIKELLSMAAAKWRAQAIPLFLGKDAAGQPVVADLTQMPHLLIAGTTGSGKSICVSSIVMSILMTRTPSEVNMILVDPKVVELSIFKEIPHLMCPIVTEAGKAEGILDWAATKMDERYALLAEAGVKDIKSYNRLGREGLRDRFGPITDEELDKIPQFLPYIVIVIDELADLMMTSAKEVEFFLCRLAQKSRAVGIHLIVSTQRPQANVVTGLIKSNLPCRIAFRVSSRLDSRIVLDQNGGEVLLGQGDMLYLPPGSSKLVRAQGTFISDEELRSIVKHACAQAAPQFHPELVRMPGGGDLGGERDELFDSAVEMILESGRGSVSLLQRRLEVGYSRASRLIDQMYASGIVGEYKGSQAREVILSKEEWQKIKAARDREEAAAASEEAAME